MLVLRFKYLIHLSLPLQNPQFSRYPRSALCEGRLLFSESLETPLGHVNSSWGKS
jgi:hypothetical protein